MRMLVILAVAISGALSLAPPADASHLSKPRVYSNSYYYGGRDHYRWRKARKYTHDYARAQNLDPAGDYKAYPDWARAALSPKSDGNNRR